MTQNFRAPLLYMYFCYEYNSFVHTNALASFPSSLPLLLYVQAYKKILCKNTEGEAGESGDDASNYTREHIQLRQTDIVYQYIIQVHKLV